MSWRTVVISTPSKLDLKLGYLVMRDSEKTTRVHLSELAVLVIESNAVSITTALLNQLANENIPVIICDEKHNPSAELIALYGFCKAPQNKRNQAKWTPEQKGVIWTDIVHNKILNQAKCLEYFNIPEYLKLKKYLEELEYNDATNREGHSAKVYFNSLFTKEFTRSSECPINAALNYGYSILLSCINREIVASGYLTEFGIFHDNVFNNFNLSCDIIEPLRPIVDGYVKLLNPDDFDNASKMKILNLLNIDFNIDGRKQTLNNAIRIYTKSVLQAIDKADVSLIKYFSYEL